ncbi:hypothetical protein D3C78_1624570 [compost metagenome]
MGHLMHKQSLIHIIFCIGKIVSVILSTCRIVHLTIRCYSRILHSKKYPPTTVMHLNFAVINSIHEYSSGHSDFSKRQRSLLAFGQRNIFCGAIYFYVISGDVA